MLTQALSAISGNRAVAANLYQAAMRAWVPAGRNDDWVAKNQKAISLALEASRYPGPVFNDPRTYDDPGV